MKGLALFSFLWLLSCSSVSVVHDYDPELDYSGYRVYDFFQPMDSRLGPLDTRRAIRSIDQILQSRGYIKATATIPPQFYVNIESEMIQEAPSGSLGLGLGSTGGQVGGGVSVGIPVGDPALKQIIYLDLIDVAGDALFWQARIQAPFREAIDAKEREERMFMIMEKALSAFPPSIKKQ